MTVDSVATGVVLGVVVTALVTGIVATRSARRAEAAMIEAREQVDAATRAAKHAGGRARAMGEHRVHLEVIFQEWGLEPLRSAQLAAEVRGQVSAEVEAGKRAAGAASMTSVAARRTEREREQGPDRFRVPRDGGPRLGPEGTRRSHRG